MSYIWIDNYLEKEQLKQAFNKAAFNKQNYLIHFGTSTNDFACMLNEHTAEANDDTLRDVLTHNYSEHDNLHVINVYDTSKDFEGAVLAQKLEAVREDLAAIKREVAMAARPWWKELLNLEP